MKANDNIKNVFENYGTNVLVISDYEIDDDYEQLFLEDDDEKWTEIKEAIMSL